MPADNFDLAILGAGSCGLTAARFAAQLGARVALIEKHRIGGDCTWTGCVPSKALLKAAKVAHEIRRAQRFGIASTPPAADMAAVRAYVRRAIGEVYQSERPEELARLGIHVLQGHARFTSASTLDVDQRPIRAGAFLIATGAIPRIPSLPGLDQVPFLTYQQIFDLDRLPEALIVIGGGPIGMELAQAFQRLGSRVTLIAPRLLPRDAPEAGARMAQIFQEEGVRLLTGRAASVRRDGAAILVAAAKEEVRGDALLVASGRAPAIQGLDLDRAGVRHTASAIPVDRYLRTNVSHIYAAGDVTGGPQFTHLAGWQGFHAARNALLPGRAPGLGEFVPWVTFTDPEVAHVGLSEDQARDRGIPFQTHRWEMAHTDRAICEDDTRGFLHVLAAPDGVVLGATAVHARAGETIAELAVAVNRRLKLSALAGVMHPYPAYATAVQQLAAESATAKSLSGTTGRILRALSKWTR